jgi:hypothetical protein
VDSVEELISMGKKYERVNRDVERYKPRPDLAQTFVQETAYKPHRGKSICGIKRHLNTATVVPITKQRESATVKKRNSGQTSHEAQTTLGKVCWNCNNPGHVFFHCKQPKRLFCHVCGKPNKFSYTCGCDRSRSPRGAEPHSASTSGHRVSRSSSSKIVSAGMLSRHSSPKGRC